MRKFNKKESANSIKKRYIKAVIGLYGENAMSGRVITTTKDIITINDYAYNKEKVHKMINQINCLIKKRLS